MPRLPVCVLVCMSGALSGVVSEESTAVKITPKNISYTNIYLFYIDEFITELWGYVVYL